MKSQQNYVAAPRKNRTRRLKAITEATDTARSPALRLAAGDESPVCLLGDIHSVLETCSLARIYFSYAPSKNSS